MERTLRLGSVSRTARARRALAAVGIRAEMKKAAGAGVEGGCAWGLSVPEEQLYTATIELRRLGVGYEVL